MPREFKQKARFTAIARCLVEKAGTQFAVASLNDLKTILPSDYDQYSDLMPIAGNVAVANMGNENGDIVDSAVALAMLPKFVHKCVNVEHNPLHIVGHLTTSGLTAFSPSYAIGAGSQPISAEEVKDSKMPFNIAVGGFVYESRFPAVAEKIASASDPNSASWLTVSFSWELSFDDNRLAVGSRDLSEAEIIDDPKIIEAWRPLLKCNGGSGYTPDGKELYRLVTFSTKEDGSIDYDSVVPEAVALTLAPAGDVAGVLVPDTKENVAKEDDKNELAVASVENKLEKNDEIISQSDNTVVTTNTKMKAFTKLEEIITLDDESAKQYSFANVGNVINASFASQLQTEMKKASDTYEASINEKSVAIQKAEAAAKEATDSLAKVQAALAANESKLAEIQKAQEAAAAVATFNQRMAFFDETYELADSDRKAIASAIQGLDETSFTNIKDNQLQVLLASKNKEVIAKQKEEAAKQASTASVAEVAQKALASATVTDPEVTSTVDAVATSLKAKYAEAFGEKSMKLSVKR